MRSPDLYPASALVGSPEEPPHGRSVLVVDDEEGIRDLVGTWLRMGGYSVTTASTADDALAELRRGSCAVALCDIRMPGRDGLWLAERIRTLHPDTAVIMVTGLLDVGPAVESLRSGVVDYLTKPFGRDRLREAMWRALEWHRAAWQAQRWREALELEMRTRHAMLADTLESLHVADEDGLDAMLATVMAGTPDAYAHAYRVAALAVGVARALCLSDAETATIERGALLHDIGKFAIPEALLSKPAPLTPPERQLVTLYPGLGSALVERVPWLADAATIVRQTHERMDGRGFPSGLRGEEIRLGARIVCVADAYDTMTRARVFREAVSTADAMAELARCAGTQFDPRVVEAFRRVVSIA